MERVLQYYTEMPLLFCYDLAEKRGFLVSHHDCWTSDVQLAGLPGKLIWEEVRRRGQSRSVVVETGQSILKVSCEDRELSVSVFGTSHENNLEDLARIRALFPLSVPMLDHVDVNFWYYTDKGPRSCARRLKVPQWKSIEMNYPTSTWRKLEKLRTIQLGEDSGKLLLWQGEPGTGKTFALRSLAEIWSSWCRVHCVLDPEKFFAMGDYLLGVILGEDDAGAQKLRPSGAEKPWRLLVLEDAGEMLAKDAKAQVGQGVARLLNLCDGLLGQGLRVLVLITTNEPIGALHPAVSRPGRCLSQISFEKFDALSAARWLEAHGVESKVNGHRTLADLYALSRGVEIGPKAAVGF